MMQATLGQRPTRLLLTVLFSTVVGGTSSWGQDCDAGASISVGNSTAPGGRVAVHLRGGSLCEVTGFSLAIGHDPKRVQFESAQPGPFLRGHAGSQLLFSAHGRTNLEYVTLVASFAQGGVPPTSIPENTLLATLFYRIKSGGRGQVTLTIQDRAFGNPPLANIFTTLGTEIRPRLQDGSIRRLLGCDGGAMVSVGSAGAPAGMVSVEMRGSSACEVTGFTLTVGHDARIEFVRAEPGSFLTGHAGDTLLFQPTPNNNRNFMALRVAFDSRQPMTGKATSIPEDSHFATLFYRIKPRVRTGTVVLRNRSRTFGDPAIVSVFTTPSEPLEPALGDGAIRITANQAPFSRGDADADGDLDVNDAITVISDRISQGATPPCLDAVDADDNGLVNLNDSVYLLNFLLGGGPPPPAPFMECGPDPTADGLSCQSFELCE